MDTNTANELLNQRDVASLLGKSESWCERARWCGEGPPYTRAGRTVRYFRGDVISWLRANTRTSTRDTGAHS